MPSKAPIYRPPGVTRGWRPVTKEQTAARKFRDSSAWHKCREYFRAQNPLCFLCNREGRVRPGASVHHIEPLVKRPDLGLELSNLANLCTECHDRIEKQERRGISTAHLFR